MREILFRGKRIDNNRWIEGTLIATTAVQTKYYIVDSCWCESQRITEKGCADFNWIEAYEVIPKTVGQYTGLTDKNGKKIFKGDILESPIGRKAVVSFGTYKPWSTKDSDDFECWKLTLIADDEGETKLECGLGKHCTEYMRIIGNIHDNPDLLGGAE